MSNSTRLLRGLAAATLLVSLLAISRTANAQGYCRRSGFVAYGDYGSDRDYRNERCRERPVYYREAAWEDGWRGHSCRRSHIVYTDYDGYYGARRCHTVHRVIYEPAYYTTYRSRCHRRVYNAYIAYRSGPRRCQRRSGFSVVLSFGSR